MQPAEPPGASSAKSRTFRVPSTLTCIATSRGHAQIVNGGQVEDLARLLLDSGNALQPEVRRRDVPHHQFNPAAKMRIRFLDVLQTGSRLSDELRLDQADGLMLRRPLQDPGQKLRAEKPGESGKEHDRHGQVSGVGRLCLAKGFARRLFYQTPSRFVDAQRGRPRGRGGVVSGQWCGCEPAWLWSPPARCGTWGPTALRIAMNSACPACPVRLPRQPGSLV